MGSFSRCLLLLLPLTMLPGGVRAEAESGASGAAVRASSRPELVVQSHRGAGVLAPENTREAFELGWEMGTIPEADVRTTRDGVIVAFHDADFSRVVHDADAELSKKGVKDLSFAELGRLEVGAETGDASRRRKILRMADFFELMRGRPERWLYLDIKQVDFPALAREVREYGVTAQVVLASSRLAELQEWKRLVPESETLLWVGGAEPAMRAKFAEAGTAGFQGVTQLQLHVRRREDGSWQPSDEFVREAAAELKPRGILLQALPWGAKDPEAYSRLLALGVESFATDHPDVVMPVMRAVRQQRKEAHGASGRPATGK